MTSSESNTAPAAKRLKTEDGKVLPSILHHIGNTPLVRINRISKSLKCELLAKCEFFNAGGSIKDRIGLNMILDAEASGSISANDGTLHTLIEPTSGNTGIGLALTAAVKGYRCIITLPEKMSLEKVNVLKALGAEIIRTPTEASFDSPESHIGVAARLQAEIPNSHILNQYTNAANPDVHYNTTAEELLVQCQDKKIDMLVAGVGTGGTITGIARKLREANPNIIIVGVDPVGSILAEGTAEAAAAAAERKEDLSTPYVVEGIGYDFIPDVLDRNVVNQWVKTKDKESFIMARRLIREEGLLCGGSSGSIMAAAVKAAAALNEGQRCVVILPDSTRNYMTKFLNDSWMESHGYVQEGAIFSSDNYKKYRPDMETWWSKNSIEESLKLPSATCISPSVTIKEAIDIMNSRDFDQLPVVEQLSDDKKKKNVMGVVTIGNLLAKVSSGRILSSSVVKNVMYKNYKSVSSTDTLAVLAGIFDKDYYAVVTNDENSIALATRIDLLNYITKKE